MAGWFAGRLAPAPVSQSRAPLVAGAPDSGHGRNDMVSNPVPDFGLCLLFGPGSLGCGFQSSNDVHIDYECLSHLKWAFRRQPERAAEFWRVVRDLFDRLGVMDALLNLVAPAKPLVTEHK